MGHGWLGRGLAPFNWDSSKYVGSTDGCASGSRHQRQHPVGTTPSGSCRRVVAAGAEDGQLMLNLSNGQAIRYTDIKAMV